MLMRVTGSVDCFRYACVCPPDLKIKYSVFYSICVLMFMYYNVCYFTGLFYAVVRQISMLFIDNKDSVFCIPPMARLGGKEDGGLGMGREGGGRTNRVGGGVGVGQELVGRKRERVMRQKGRGQLKQMCPQTRAKIGLTFRILDPA